MRKINPFPKSNKKNGLFEKSEYLETNDDLIRNIREKVQPIELNDDDMAFGDEPQEEKEKPK